MVQVYRAQLSFAAYLTSEKNFAPLVFSLLSLSRSGFGFI